LLTDLAKLVGAWARSQPLILTGEQSGLRRDRDVRGLQSLRTFDHIELHLRVLRLAASQSVAPEAARWSPTRATRSASPSESGVAVTDCYRHSSVTSRSAVTRYGVLGQSAQAAEAQARSLGSGHPTAGGGGSPMAGVAAVTRITSGKLHGTSGTASGW
jgi:hypothetical protein